MVGALVGQGVVPGLRQRLRLAERPQSAHRLRVSVRIWHHARLLAGCGRVVEVLVVARARLLEAAQIGARKLVRLVAEVRNVECPVVQRLLPGRSLRVVAGARKPVQVVRAAAETRKAGAQQALQRAGCAAGRGDLVAIGAARLAREVEVLPAGSAPRHRAAARQVLETLEVEAAAVGRPLPRLLLLLLVARRRLPEVGAAERAEIGHACLRGRAASSRGLFGRKSELSQLRVGVGTVVAIARVCGLAEPKIVALRGAVVLAARDVLEVCLGQGRTLLHAGLRRQRRLAGRRIGVRRVAGRVSAADRLHDGQSAHAGEGGRVVLLAAAPRLGGLLGRLRGQVEVQVVQVQVDWRRLAASRLTAARNRLVRLGLRGVSVGLIVGVLNGRRHLLVGVVVWVVLLRPASLLRRCRPTLQLVLVLLAHRLDASLFGQVLVQLALDVIGKLAGDPQDQPAKNQKVCRQ